jgi:carbon storage regulator|tara:strand:- start:240 stop:545 length:306 start_codon:yes stop_codon:yes gene_type:complete
MLVLSRHRDEAIMIGDDVVITIVDIRGDKVRLGIDAPQAIPVHRQEVYDAIQRENQKAAQSRPGDSSRLEGEVDDSSQGGGTEAAGDYGKHITPLYGPMVY